MKRVPLIMVALIAVLLFALPSGAVSPNRVGEKNFERAWQYLTRYNREVAAQHFTKSANAFAEALAQETPSRKSRFNSNLTNVGMSFYFVGRYDESIAIMSEVYEKNDDIWESSLFSALAHASKGNKEMTVKWLERYLEVLPGQRLLSTTVTNPKPQT